MIKLDGVEVSNPYLPELMRQDTFAFHLSSLFQQMINCFYQVANIEGLIDKGIETEFAKRNGQLGISRDQDHRYMAGIFIFSGMR